jgi:hypothetical protein
MRRRKIQTILGAYMSNIPDFHEEIQEKKIYKRLVGDWQLSKLFDMILQVHEQASGVSYPPLNKLLRGTIPPSKQTPVGHQTPSEQPSAGYHTPF